MLIGCSGWSYSDSFERGGWVKLFYPDVQSKKLPYYAQFFNTAEMDATFYEKFYMYMTKDTFTAMNRATPANFQFSVKVPETVTHDNRLDVNKGAMALLNEFLEKISPLKYANKLGAVLIQLPPSFTVKEFQNTEEFLDRLPSGYDYAVEFRHPSWFSDLAYNFFLNNKICMVWNQLDKIQSPPVVTSDFVYLRLIGDRSISEEEFGIIQKDRQQEMEYWSDKFGTVAQNEKDVKIGIVAANNHYAGFGAATANMFRLMRGLPSVQWGVKKQIDNVSNLQFPDEQSTYRRTKQKTMLDYTSN